MTVNAGFLVDKVALGHDFFHINPVFRCQSMPPPNPTSLRSTLILSSHLRPDLVSFPEVFPPNPFMYLPSPHTCYMSCPSQS